MFSSNIALVSRMVVADADVVIVVPPRPVLGAYRTTATAVEGSSIIFEVRRSGVQVGGCSCTWTAVSAAGTADLAAPTTGTVSFGNNVTAPVQVAVKTNNRTGTQGDRDVTFVVSNGQGGDLDPTRLSATTTLKDSTAPTLWWQLATTRGGRTDKRASGPSYWAASLSDVTNLAGRYEREVGLMDCFNGGNGEKGGPYNDTMLLTTGGPTGTINDTITNNSQLDWRLNNSHWVTGWRNFPTPIWCVWTVNFTSLDERTDGGDNSIWQDIIDGVWRNAYISMGMRIKKNIDTPALNPKGHKADKLILRMNHENNQSNFNIVHAAFGQKYKDAMTKAIDWIKQGLGDYAEQVKFAHAPAHGHENLGLYNAWAPTNTDIYSVSWHPTNLINSQAKLDAYMAGTDETAAYGPEEVVALARAQTTPTPIMFPEWSPKCEWTASLKNACPIADTVVQRWNTFLTANQDWCVCDCVYVKTSLMEMLTPNAYQNTDAAGIAQWQAMVPHFKSLWGKPIKGP